MQLAMKIRAIIGSRCLEIDGVKPPLLYALVTKHLVRTCRNRHQPAIPVFWIRIDNPRRAGFLVFCFTSSTAQAITQNAMFEYVVYSVYLTEILEEFEVDVEDFQIECSLKCELKTARKENQSRSRG